MSEAKPEVQLVVKNGVRAAVSEEFQVGGEFYDALSAEVQRLIDDAERRAAGNGRSTLKARDV